MNLVQNPRGGGYRFADDTGAARTARRAGVLLVVATLTWPSILVGIANVAVAATTLYVSNQGDDANQCTEASPCATINHAIALASAGDTIRVAAGTYAGNFTVDKSLTLLGARAGDDARTRSGQESVITPTSNVRIYSNDVELNGFTIQGASVAGVETSASHSGYTITSNIFEDNTIGLNLSTAVPGAENIVRFNLFRDNNRPGAASGNGIYSEGMSNALIDSNRFIDNNNASVTIDNRPSENIRITNNEGSSGVAFQNVNGAVIEGNRLSAADGSAIALMGVNDHAEIRGNSLTNSQNGISVFDLSSFTGSPPTGPNSGITVADNNITGNKEAGIVVTSGSANPSAPALEGTLHINGNFFTGNGNDIDTSNEAAVGGAHVIETGRLPSPVPLEGFETSTRLTVVPRVQREGRRVTLIASAFACRGGPAIGRVTFRANERMLGVVRLRNAVATLTLRNLPVGRHTITAEYLGNLECSGSESRRVTVVIVRAPTPPLPVPPIRARPPYEPVSPYRPPGIPMTG